MRVWAEDQERSSRAALHLQPKARTVSSSPRESTPTGGARILEREAKSSLLHVNGRVSAAEVPSCAITEICLCLRSNGAAVELVAPSIIFFRSYLTFDVRRVLHLIKSFQDKATEDLFHQRGRHGKWQSFERVACRKLVHSGAPARLTEWPCFACTFADRAVRRFEDRRAIVPM